jgi:hypothetical protein
VIVAGLVAFVVFGVGVVVHGAIRLVCGTGVRAGAAPSGEVAILLVARDRADRIGDAVGSVLAGVQSLRLAERYAFVLVLEVDGRLDTSYLAATLPCSATRVLPRSTHASPALACWGATSRGPVR